ncbi:hypothetical protein M438DRAFT_75366 [Aureobasidium pullulans EXF-150]|uniref:F-box domain-containing protein n=1 Tax=Aureobasidium pullulans EXF-150 TaxID=1043002 RepID=A0A074X818_AURPU|nr:uncharacterized protein M438DRAFT_75366 [Aureobasidium pullulans EXF-150]KEQ81538.1 hypothetical protein M438DRAFT_75366 [Aureobasidium pullulans EXF-150]
MIANNLDLKDLAPCRLVSKSMSEAANNRFAKVFFSRRFHVASSYSVKALVDITAHPFFGKHVTAVIMDGVRMTKHRSRGGPTLWTDPYDEEEEMRDDSEEESASILDNAFVRSGQCQSLLQKVFENIKGYGNSVEVGVGDCKYNNGVRSFGRKALLNHKVLYTYFMAETLGLTLAAAEAAKCPIQKLRVDIQGEAGEDYRQKSVRLDMRDNLQEIGRASAQGTEDLIKDTQEQSIDLLKQKVLLVRFNHVEYAGVIKIIVPNIQTQGSEV